MINTLIILPWVFNNSFLICFGDFYNWQAGKEVTYPTSFQTTTYQICITRFGTATGNLYNDRIKIKTVDGFTMGTGGSGGSNETMQYIAMGY